MNDNPLIVRYKEAVNLLNNNQLEEAATIFMDLQKDSVMAPYCHYHLAHISNRTDDPEMAYMLFYKAFEAEPNLPKVIYGENHPSYNYVFKVKMPEKSRTDCPLCSGQGTPRWCYVLPEESNYNESINPVRMWMYCEPCNHIFARDFPEKIFLHNTKPRKAIPTYFSYYSKILTSIRQYATGMSLFEIGVGACECLLAAREIGYDTFGIDVIERHVEDAKKLYKLNAETADFNEYQSDRLWDVIIMGDVLEHVNDPVRAIEKAASLLSDEGALWISTPNFESAYSAVSGHNDVMRKQQYHLNYFSRESLYNLLAQFNLAPVDYQISGHYSGSMEVIAIKESRLA